MRRVEALTHGEAPLRNIPTAEHEPVMAEGDRSPIEVAYERRHRDLDPQLVRRGKDEQNWSDPVVQAPPLFIQEKVHQSPPRRRDEGVSGVTDDRHGRDSDGT